MAQLTRAPTSDFATGGTIGYSAGTTGWSLVNDHPDTADPLTSYVQFGTTANSFIAFGFTAFDVPAGSTINFVRVDFTDEEPSNGANSATARLRIGGTYYDHGTTHNPSTTTTARQYDFTTNPRTTSAWTVAEVNGTDGSNALQHFGVIGADSNPAWRLGSIQIVVDYTLPNIAVSTQSGDLSVTGQAPTIATSSASSLYYVIGPSSGWSDPSATEVKAGQLAGGGAATAYGNEASPSTSQTFTFSSAATGLSASTSYKVAIVWSSGSDNSNVAVSDAFTTEGVAETVLTATGALSLTGQAPTVNVNNVLASTQAGALTITGQAPSALVKVVTTTETGALSLTGQAPTVTVTANTQVVTVSGALTLTGNAPTATVNNVVAATAVGALSLAGQAPTLLVNNALVATQSGALTLAGQAPTAGVKVAVETATGALSLAGQAPSVNVRVVAATATGALSIVGQAPTVTVQNTLAATQSGALVFVGQAPNAAVSTAGNVDVFTVSGGLTLVGQAPTLLVNNVFAATQTGALSLAGQAPTVLTKHATSTQTGALTLAGQAPTIGVITPAVTIETSSGTLVLECYAPSILGGEITPSRNTGAGRSRKKYKRRYVVEIDGQDFVVESEAEAAQLLDTAKEVAEEVVERAKPANKVKLPRIRVKGEPGPELESLIADVSAVRNEIRAMVEEARRNAEIAYLMRLADDEEAISLLL